MLAVFWRRGGRSGGWGLGGLAKSCCTGCLCMMSFESAQRQMWLMLARLLYALIGNAATIFFYIKYYYNAFVFFLCSLYMKVDSLFSMLALASGAQNKMFVWGVRR